MKSPYLIIGTLVFCLFAVAPLPSTAAPDKKAPAAKAETKKNSQSKTKKKSKIKYEGGDGSSMEKAIIIKGAVSSTDGVAAEYDYIKKKYKNYDTKMQGLQKKDGKRYDVITFATKDGNVTLYFDITDFFGKFGDD